MLIGKVRYNGNHYFAGEEVKGTNVMVDKEGLWLLDDTEYEVFGITISDPMWVNVSEVRIVEDE